MKTTTFALAMVAAAGLLLGAQTAAAQAAGDPAMGAKTFGARCAVCHGKDAAGGPMAPSLHGIVGRKAASAAFPRYSAALRASGLAWTAANLNTFVAAPQKVVPGTQMMSAITSATDRQNVVAYLASLKE